MSNFYMPDENGTFIQMASMADIPDISSKADLVNGKVPYSELDIFPTIVVTASMIISQDPLTLQLTAEQDAIITNPEYKFINLDATALGIGATTFNKTSSNISGDYIFTQSGINYNVVSKLPTNGAIQCVVYTHSTMQAVYSELKTPSLDENGKVPTSQLPEMSTIKYDSFSVPIGYDDYTATLTTTSTHDVNLINVICIQNGEEVMAPFTRDGNEFTFEFSEALTLQLYITIIYEE